MNIKKKIKAKIDDFEEDDSISGCKFLEDDIGT
jgi:hypothetical protein